MLNTKYLQYLDAIYRHKNFTRASAELFVSQPAISAAITSLEKELGCTLMVRSSKGVTFTMEGEQLMLYVKQILRDLREAQRTMEDLADGGNCSVRLGVSPTLSVRLLPLIYTEFLPQWPRATVRLAEGTMNNHVEKIQSEILDLSYNALPNMPDPSLNVIPLTNSQIMVVLRPDHPLARYERFPLSAFHGQEIVMHDEKSMIYHLLEDAFHQEGIVPRIVSYHEQIMCMFQMIGIGGYVGFINTDPGHHTFSLADKGLLQRPLAEPIGFNVGFMMKANRHLPKICRDLIRYTKGVVPPPGHFSG